MKNEERWIKSQITVELIPYNMKSIEDDKKVIEFIEELKKELDVNELISPLVFSSITEDDYTRFLDALEKEGTISPVIEDELYRRDIAREQEGIVGFSSLYEGYIIIRSIKSKLMYIQICLNKEVDEQKVIQFINRFWDTKVGNVSAIKNFFSKETEVFSKQYKFPKLRVI